METVNSLQPDEVKSRINNRETFVVNVVAAWCPDCTERQKPNLPGFMEKLKSSGIPFYNLTVQHERRVFLSERHEEITAEFGGHGYPRTVLIIKGVIQPDSPIEVLTSKDLEDLATKFMNQI